MDDDIDFDVLPPQVRGEFTLTIRLGNDLMQSADDIADALRRVADRIDGGPLTDLADERVVMDRNGQRVGTYTLTLED